MKELKELKLLVKQQKGKKDAGVADWIFIDSDIATPADLFPQLNFWRLLSDSGSR